MVFRFLHILARHPAGIIVCVLLIGCVLFWPRLSAALPPNSSYTESEKIGFAFSQLGNFPPKYEDWIKEMDEYKKSTPTEKVEFMQHETMRLKNGFYNYNTDIDLTKIQISARLRASNYYGQSQRNSMVTEVNMELLDLPENYFPFYIGGVWVAVVIKDFDKFTHFAFSSDEYKEFATKVGLKQGYQLIQKVKVDMSLRPISVDTSSPIRLDGIDMWLMMAEVGEMTIWRPMPHEKLLVWAYSAPWYTSSSELELLRLYKE